MRASLVYFWAFVASGICTLTFFITGVGIENAVIYSGMITLLLGIQYDVQRIKEMVMQDE